MASIINATTSSGVAVSGDTSGVLQLATNGGTTAVTIDTSQNVGIGTTSPAAKLDVRGSSSFLINATNPTAWVSVDSGLSTQSMYMQVNTSTSDTRLGSYTSHPLLLLTANTERMRIDSSGNVGIGTSSPNAYGAGYDTLQVAGSTAGIVQATGNSNAIIMEIIGNTGAGTGQVGTRTNTALAFKTNNTEVGRFDTSGNLLVGTTGISTGTFKGIQCGINAAGTGNYLSQNPAGTSTRQWAFGHNNADQYVVYGYNNTTFNTGAYIAWGGTSWTASSDERLKDIIEPITDAVNKVSTLRTVIGKYKTDEEGTRRAFLIAQDVQKVLPEAVDAADPEKLGVSYTDVIPLLVASIKEQQALITTLQTQVAELKQKVGA